MNSILIPFTGACLLLYLAGTLTMFVAFMLDCKDARKYGKAATRLFCGGYLFLVVASIFAMNAFFVYFSNGGL